MLLELMLIVQAHGRKPEYNFENDIKLKKILKGEYGLHTKNDKKSVTLAFDSFLTIWLLTLPEKFKEWYNFHPIKREKPYEKPKYLDYTESPSFPTFVMNQNSTKLHPVNEKTVSYKYLQKLWNLQECFIHYLQQKELWTTNSIEAEYAPKPAPVIEIDIPDENPPEEKSTEEKSPEEKSLEGDESSISVHNEGQQDLQVGKSNECSDNEQGPKESGDKEHRGLGMMDVDTASLGGQSLVIEDGFEDNINYKPQSDEENTCGSNRRSHRKKPNPSEDYAGKQGSSPHKKQRKGTKENTVEITEENYGIHPAAVREIKKLSKTVYNSRVLLNSLYLNTLDKKSHDMIDQIRREIDKVAEIKSALIAFAENFSE